MRINGSKAAVAVLSLAALCAAGCTTNTKGSWACRAERGGVCTDIADIDNAPAGRVQVGRTGVNAPLVDGSQPVRWWLTGNMTAAPGAGSPRREGDQVLKVLVAPWIDANGDFHGRTEIFAVMRRGGWWLNAPGAADPRGQVIAAIPAPAVPSPGPLPAQADPRRAALDAPAATASVTPAAATVAAAKSPAS